MTAKIIDGRAAAARLRAEVAARVEALKARSGVTPGLTVVLAGDDPASATYVRNKEKAAVEVGMNGRTLRLSASVTVAELERIVDELNADPAVHGMLLQLPLPAGVALDQVRALQERIHPDKDVDGLHPLNVGRLLAGAPCLPACTPAGCMRLLAEAGVSPAGKRAVVIGRSAIVGKPMALLLLEANATVTICHSRTADLPAVCREADILVAAVGRPRLVRRDWIKPGACVIDVGTSRDPETGKLAGDVAFDEVAEVAGAITPVPGGVGPMTVASLLANTCTAAERAAARL
jgi:methylenetetrahydrofolate dehydrogenase (NADP+)/methenyltetrahydrofolate cyclohydrolase